MATKRDPAPATKPARTARAAPRAAPRAAKPRKKKPGPKTLTRRVEEAIDHELSRIEAILIEGGGGERGEAERRARTLATLARTLKEVTRLRTDAEKTKAADDDLPRDLDEFRRELSRRLDLLVAEAAALHPEPAERG